MPDRLRWGILGTGWIARAFTRDLLLDGHAVTAVGSRSREAAGAFAREFGIAAAHATYEALVTAENVDAVYVATPHPMHHANAALALAAGKHTLVEKPFTLNAVEATDLVQMADRSGLVLLEAMWTRWLPHMAQIREILAGGALGEVRSMTADHCQLLSADPAHRVNAPALGGGALLDLGVYPVSFASQLFGTPDTVQAAATLTRNGVDSQIATMFTYRGGAIATSYSAMTTRGPNVATVIGTRGRIDIDAVWYAPADFRVCDSRGAVVESYTSQVEGRGMQFQAREFESLVREGRRTSDVLPLAETVSIMRTLDEIRAQVGVRYPGEAAPAGPAPAGRPDPARPPER